MTIGHGTFGAARSKSCMFLARSQSRPADKTTVTLEGLPDDGCDPVVDDPGGLERAILSPQGVEHR